MSMNLSISKESYTLIEPNLHDGRLLGIAIPADRSVEVAVADVAGEGYTIVLEDVLAFHASDFWEGNIILDVTIMRGEEVRLSDLEPLGGQMHEKNLRETLGQIAAKSLFVVQLCPSYGCYFLAVAGGIAIRAKNEAGT